MFFILSSSVMYLFLFLFFFFFNDTATTEIYTLSLHDALPSLPPPAADEFYHADLIGLRAMTADGTEIGTVAAVHDFGAGDILELRPQAGGTTIMVPFTAAFVPSVDIAGGRIVVAPPEDGPANRGTE